MYQKSHQVEKSYQFNLHWPVYMQIDARQVLSGIWSRKALTATAAQYLYITKHMTGWRTHVS